jgi:hypothetical protein
VQNQPGFIGFVAEVGLTKHIGSLEATEEIFQIGETDRWKICPIDGDWHANGSKFTWFIC